MLGLALATPLPLPRIDVLRPLTLVALRTLIAPAAASIALLVVVVLLRGSDQITGPPGVVLTTYYWPTLGFVAWRLCVLVARCAAATSLPSNHRLAAALLFLGLGLGLAATQRLISGFQAGLHPSFVAQTLTLAFLATEALGTGQDLRHGRR